MGGAQTEGVWDREGWSRAPHLVWLAPSSLTAGRGTTLPNALPKAPPDSEAPPLVPPKALPQGRLCEMSLHA